MFIRIMAMLFVASAALSAQRGGGGLTGAQETALPTIGQQQTIAEQFINQMRIDIKNQGAQVDEILLAGTKAGLAISSELDTARRQMANAAIGNSADDMKAGMAAYSAAAAKMAALEVQSFMKVHAILKPNQQSREPEGFAIMAGIFLRPYPAAPRPQQGPRTGAR